MFNYSLKKNKTLYSYIYKAPIAFIFVGLFIALFTLSCGKRTPPVPPTEKIPQRTLISGIQQGSHVLLQWKMPIRNTTVGNTEYIKRIDIYRLIEPAANSQQITEEDFSTRSTLIDSIPISDDDFSLKTFTYADNLQFSSQKVRISYAIKFVNNSGQKASFSNFLTVEPSPRIAKNPSDLETSVTQGAISIKWTKPLENVDGSTPANVLGYNIYKKNKDDNEAVKINVSPLSDPSYDDNFFEFDKTYSYFVRTVSIGTEGEPVESSNSEEVMITPKDTFAPVSPQSITIASSPNSISLFFAANIEKDILGYKIFRTENNNIPLDRWELLTKEPVNTNTFIDKSVISGVKYFYYIIAIDQYGNESPPSEIVSELTP